MDELEADHGVSDNKMFLEIQMSWVSFATKNVVVQNIYLLIVFTVLYTIFKDGFVHPDTHVHPIIDALYFATCTQSTVGYGEIHPKLWWTKLLVILHICISITINVIIPLRKPL